MIPHQHMRQTVFSLLPLPAACLGTTSFWGHLEVLTWLLTSTLHVLTMILFEN